MWAARFPISRAPLLALAWLALARAPAGAAPETDEQRLASLWRHRHPGEPLPTCGHADPVATLDASVTPGRLRLHVIADGRYGIAVFDARGGLLASGDLGCTGWPDDVAGDQRVHLALLHDFGPLAPPDLAVTTRAVGHCGEFRTLDLFGWDLESHGALDLGGERGCSLGQWTLRSRLRVPEPGTIVVDYVDRERRLDRDGERFGAWHTTRTRCTYRFSTRAGMFVTGGCDP